MKKWEEKKKGKNGKKRLKYLFKLFSILFTSFF